MIATLSVDRFDARIPTLQHPAGSCSYGPSPEGVREEVREGDLARPLGVPGVAAQVFGRGS